MKRLTATHGYVTCDWGYNMKTAWFNKEILPKSMLNSGFKPLDLSEHFPSLKKCFEGIPPTTLLDIGCGAAEVSQAFSDFDYTGVDLPHVIEEVAKKKNPHKKYIHFDANKGPYEFVKNHDIVLMNSFISEVPNWYFALSNILYRSKKYVIIHRQEVTNSKTSVEDYITYGGLKTTKTVINYSELLKLFEMNGFKLINDQSSFPNENNVRTFLLKKQEKME